MITEPSTPSGQVTVTTAAIVSNAPAILTSLILVPGSAASTVTIYDNATASASGTILAQLAGVANGAAVTYEPASGIRASKGIAIVVTGTAATASCAFQPTF